MEEFPEINLNQLFNLTDSTGVFQHARLHIPNRNHGYCLDDTVRALLVLALYKECYPTNEEIEKLIQIYLSFTDHAYNSRTKRYRNFMSYSQIWIEEEGSDDSQGRTMWAICTLISNKKFQYHHPYLEKLLQQSLSINYHFPHAIVYALLGLTNLTQQTQSPLLNVKKAIQKETEKLRVCFQKNVCKDWPWYEPVLTYDSPRFPQALLSAGQVLQNPSLIKEGLVILDWLIFHQFKNNQFNPVGNENWMTLHGKSDFDQQPLEAAAMVDACLTAGKITGHQRYFQFAKHAFDWFTGNNLINESVYDPVTGGCRDGLHANGVNQNQGAESTLAWLSSLLNMKLNQDYF